MSEPTVNSKGLIAATTDRKAVNNSLVMNGDRKRPIDDFISIGLFSKKYKRKEDNPMNKNSYNAGKLYCVYETIFKESKRSINQFANTKRNPSLMLPHLEELAKCCSCYSNYREILIEIYSEMSEIPRQMNCYETAEFLLGYHHQYNELHKKKQ